MRDAAKVQCAGYFSGKGVCLSELPIVIRILLVDDDETCLEGLRQLLSLDSDLEVVGEAANAEAACLACRTLRPDVVLIDADLPRASCLEAITNLANGLFESTNRPPVICLAVYPDQHDAALQAGAVRFLRKDGSRRELVEAVRAAALAYRKGSSSQPGELAAEGGELEA